MKKVFLITTIILIVILLFFNLIKKSNSNTDNLVGYWKPNKESSQLFFWKDVNGNLQVQEINNTNGEPIDVIELKINNDSIYIKTVFIPNNWTTKCIYTFIDKNTLKCEVTGDAIDTVIYKKIK